MTEEEAAEKYSNIEAKIPSVWPDYETAGIQLAQDIATEWDIKHGELIRVMSLISIRVPRLGRHLNGHIDERFAFYALYPEKMTAYNIKPEIKK